MGAGFSKKKYRTIDEVVHTNFRNETHRATINLLYTANCVSMTHARLFKLFNLSNAQYNVLRILRGSNPHSMYLNQIKERMLDMESDVSRVVNGLTDRNLVKRTPSKEDRRIVFLNITEEGLAILQEMDKPVNEMDNIFDSLSEAQLELFNHLLNKVRMNLKTCQPDEEDAAKKKNSTRSLSAKQQDAKIEEIISSPNNSPFN